MPVRASAAILFLLLSFQICRATTWDEPWHEAVVKNADVFIRAKVVKNDKTKVSLQIVKQLAGEKVPETLVVSGFSMLHLTSFSRGNDETEFHLTAGKEYYFF